MNQALLDQFKVLIVEVLHFNLGDKIGSNQPGVSDHVQERFQLVLFLSLADDHFGDPEFHGSSKP